MCALLFCPNASWAASRRTGRRWLMPPLFRLLLLFCLPSLLFLVVLCAKSLPPDGRTQFDGTTEWHCGRDHRKTQQTWMFNRLWILFFLSNVFISLVFLCDAALAPGVLIKAARCLSSVYNRNKMRISSRLWILLMFSGFGGLTMGAFPSSVQIGEWGCGWTDLWTSCDV